MGPDKGIYIYHDSSLVAWLTQSPGVPGLSPSADDIFSWCTHMPPLLLLLLRMTDSRSIKNVQIFKKSAKVVDM